MQSNTPVRFVESWGGHADRCPPAKKTLHSILKNQAKKNINLSLGKDIISPTSSSCFPVSLSFSYAALIFIVLSVSVAGWG